MRPLLHGTSRFVIKDKDQYLLIDPNYPTRDNRHVVARVATPQEATYLIGRENADRRCAEFNKWTRELTADPRPRPPRYEVIEMNGGEVVA